MGNKISTRNLAALPDPPRLEALTRSLAMLDAIMSPDWTYRYFLFDAAWDSAKGERLAKLDTGSGDNYYLLFFRGGIFLKGFDHEAAMTPWAFDPLKVWAGVLDQLPEAFKACLTESAFDMESTTFCIWRQTHDKDWVRGEIDFPDDADPDGSERLLWMLDDVPRTYVEFANEYDERQIPESLVRAIYSGEPLTPDAVLSLNSEADWETIVEEAAKLSYPVAKPPAAT